MFFLGSEAHPLVNAALNAASAVLLFVGWRSIRRHKTARHHRLMTSALVVSAVFLASYLVRFATTGAHPFGEGGWLKVVYYTVLFSHMSLAVVTVPLSLRTFYLARRGRFDEHRRIARWTFPIWMYVSVTGVVVYSMLYHL